MEDLVLLQPVFEVQQALLAASEGRRGIVLMMHPLQVIIDRRVHSGFPCVRWYEDGEGAMD